jgi:hypothetical protein
MENIREWLKNKNLWSGFFANLLGVVVGIMLTFGINSLWQKHEEKKKIKEMLILVRNELETNKEWFQKQEQILEQDGYAFKKILEADGKWSTIPEDSLKNYMNRFVYVRFQQLTTSAWQIFKNSEMIQKISNKELVIRLTDCYFLINLSYDFIMKNYWDKKWEAIPFEHDKLDAMMKDRESICILQIVSLNGFSEFIFGACAIIDYTISLLDKYGDFRYDMDEKDKEFDSFFDAKMDSLRQKKDSLELL